MLLYRAGTGALHKGPDALSRNPEHRDFLVLARQSEWTQHRTSIVGVVLANIDGRMGDEDPPLYALDPQQECPEGVTYIPPEERVLDCSLRSRGG